MSDSKGETMIPNEIFVDHRTHSYYGVRCGAQDKYILASTAEQRIEELKKEQEILVWNLAGCSTYALGYGLDTPHDEEWERPALRDVKKLALETRALRAEREKEKS